MHSVTLNHPMTTLIKTRSWSLSPKSMAKLSIWEASRKSKSPRKWRSHSGQSKSKSWQRCHVIVLRRKREKPRGSSRMKVPRRLCPSLRAWFQAPKSEEDKEMLAPKLDIRAMATTCHSWSLTFSKIQAASGAKLSILASKAALESLIPHSFQQRSSTSILSKWGLQAMCQLLLQANTSCSRLTRSSSRFLTVRDSEAPSHRGQIHQLIPSRMNSWRPQAATPSPLQPSLSQQLCKAWCRRSLRATSRSHCLWLGLIAKLITKTPLQRRSSALETLTNKKSRWSASLTWAALKPSKKRSQCLLTSTALPLMCQARRVGSLPTTTPQPKR